VIDVVEVMPGSHCSGCAAFAHTQIRAKNAARRADLPFEYRFM
jgi:hypothetical protein